MSDTMNANGSREPSDHAAELGVAPIDDPVARRLLASAKQYAPSDAGRARTLAAVAAIAASTTATKSAAAGVTVAAKTKWALGLVAVLGGAAITVAAVRSSGPAHEERRTTAPSAMGETTVLMAHPAPSTLPSAAASVGDPAPSAAPTSTSAASIGARPAGARSAGGSFEAELALVAKAQRALRAGDGASALAAAREHRARYPQGALSLEAQTLEAEALAATGRRSEARTRARALLSSNPNGPYAARLRALAE
jgi:hypothetical protein